jgi:hypothetical protein
MAEEMGISMDRFDVVRRAMALAAHSNDNTPALSGESPYHSSCAALIMLSKLCEAFSTLSNLNYDCDVA